MLINKKRFIKKTSKYKEALINYFIKSESNLNKNVSAVGFKHWLII